jgi:hypothetical protein
VLFAEDFESGTIEELGKRWGEMSNKEDKVMAYSSDVPPGSAGCFCLPLFLRSAGRAA